jgi:glycosyltransferase involved in cell wall biosynthesis
MAYRLTFLTVLASPYQQQLFAALDASENFEIRVLYYTKGAPDRDWEERPLGPFEEVLPGVTLSWLGASAHLNPRIISALSRDPADLFVISDYSAPSAQLAMRYLNRTGRPWIFWGELPGIRNRWWAGRVLRGLLQRPFTKGATAIAAIGAQATEAYRELTGARTAIFNIPYYCDLAPYRSATAHRRTPSGSDPIRILFSGQLIRRKGVDILVNAFLRIADQLPDARLLLLGDGPERRHLAATIPPDRREHIEFLGFLQPADIPRVFAEADVFVLPSRHDGWGVVVNEALGAGLPIIASERTGAAHDLIVPGVNGFIVPADDVTALADALLELGSSKELRASFGSASIGLSRQWDLDRAVARWTGLCQEVLGRGALE